MTHDEWMKRMKSQSPNVGEGALQYTTVLTMVFFSSMGLNPPTSGKGLCSASSWSSSRRPGPSLNPPTSGKGLCSSACWQWSSIVS